MKSRVCLSAVLLSCSLLLPSWARIGESEQQLQARYGSPVGSCIKWKLFDGLTFEKGGIRITVKLLNGVSVQEKFQKIVLGSFTNDEITALLDANSDDYKWHEFIETATQRHFWERAGGVTAWNDGYILTLTSKSMKDAEEAAKPSRETNLKGF